MITKEVKYKYGHFYDLETGKRIIIKDDKNIVITLKEPEYLLDEDPLNKELKPRDEELIIKNIKKINGLKRFNKILERNELVFFDISSGIATSDRKERIKSTFKVELLDPLFIYETSTVSMSPCNCVVKEVITENLPFFEQIYSYSLNDAYSKTYVHYFNKFGKGTCNAFTKFKYQGNEVKFLKKFS